jgi:hypothetical protein
MRIYMLHSGNGHAVSESMKVVHGDVEYHARYEVKQRYAWQGQAEKQANGVDLHGGLQITQLTPTSGIIHMCTWYDCQSMAGYIRW